MVRRYAHLAPAQLVEHAERVAPLLSGTSTAHGTKRSGLGVVGPTGFGVDVSAVPAVGARSVDQASERRARWLDVTTTAHGEKQKG